MGICPCLTSVTHWVPVVTNKKETAGHSQLLVGLELVIKPIVSYVIVKDDNYTFINFENRGPKVKILQN